jgi:3' terminal RNA ribose 2'-O-methyltransferase Hen1
MLLTITNTRYPATDLGYLLHKHPAKVQETDIRHGIARIFYPEAADDRCTCALLLDMDPVGLVRSDGNDAFALEQYVNDRPYVASSFMSTAIAKAYGSAMNGKCKDKPELVNVPLNLEVKLAVVSARGGQELLEKLFIPLGYTMTAVQHELDEQFTEWGMSRYFTLTLKHTITLQALLTHLYILLPVLDNEKHYWVAEEEIQKLLEKGKGWLEEHPARELIVRRYLKRQTSFAVDALTKLEKGDKEAIADPGPVEADKAPRLHDLRLQTVCDILTQSGASKVADLGCGEGKLLRLLLAQPQFTEITGVDVSIRSLEIANRRLKLDKLPEHQRKRIRLFQSALTYNDKRLLNMEAAALVEVIEHLDEDRLVALEKSVFGFAAPLTAIVTTPNKDWNVSFTEDVTMMRHKDHRFEWSRAEFQRWCDHVCQHYHYQCNILPLGEETENIGAPSQMAVFIKI